MKSRKVLWGIGGAVVLGLAGIAQADSTFYSMDGYRSAANSPFVNAGSSGDFWIEDFEDGLVNVSGMSISGGWLQDAGLWTDSVDADDGALDGQGSSTAGRSWVTASGQTGIMITFDQGILGGLPTAAGLVWTDGNMNSNVSFIAYGANGEEIGSQFAVLGDNTGQGTVEDDHFFGVTNAAGISAIWIGIDFMGVIEIDHVQFGYIAQSEGGGGGGESLPLPAPVAMGLAGLAVVGVLRRRRKPVVA